MRIERSRTRLSFRKRRRRSGGCLSILFSLVLIGGIGAVSWLWLNRLVLTPPSDPTDNLMASAQNAFDRGDLAGAITITRQILVSQPDDLAAIQLLARALVYRSYSDYNRAADRTTALDVTTEALRRQPTSIDVLAIHAFTLQAVGSSDAAADAALRSLEKNPNDSLARTALALAYGGAGALDAALRESQRAVQSATTDTALDALRALAITYSDTGSYDDAVRTVERAITLNRNLVTLYFERAQYALLLGDTDAATVAYFEVLTHDDNNVKARLRLCELSSLMREREQAIKYCQEVTRRAPNWSDGWYQLGMEYFLQGDFAEAQSNLHRCSTLQVLQNVPVSERRFACWYIQGQAAEIRGDCESLIAIYNEFRAMNADAQIQERWTYPPEGPPGCTAR
ncbi:MAG: tetratricopeptide repeat protein [Anaerolineae bacterium]|nr:tetratricopeptide repeat protein [Anaerolineae bacterium]